MLLQLKITSLRNSVIFFVNGGSNLASKTPKGQEKSVVNSFSINLLKNLESRN